MLKILIWFVSKDSRFFKNAINILEKQHNGLEVVGVTASEPIQLNTGEKIVPFIPLNEISRLGGGYDVLLVVGAKGNLVDALYAATEKTLGMSTVAKVANRLNLPVEKLLGDWIVCIPGFTLKKYRRLQRSHLSIFAVHCFGGLISHTLGLPFRTPLINMFTDEREYIRFLRAPRVYMEEKLIFKEKCLNEADKFYYPIFTLGNIDLHMNHYRDFDKAVAKWNERKQRINWYNLSYAP